MVAPTAFLLIAGVVLLFVVGAIVAGAARRHGGGLVVLLFALLAFAALGAMMLFSVRSRGINAIAMHTTFPSPSPPATIEIPSPPRVTALLPAAPGEVSAQRGVDADADSDDDSADEVAEAPPAPGSLTLDESAAFEPSANESKPVRRANSKRRSLPEKSYRIERYPNGGPIGPQRLVANAGEFVGLEDGTFGATGYAGAKILSWVDVPSEGSDDWAMLQDVARDEALKRLSQTLVNNLGTAAGDAESQQILTTWRELPTERRGRILARLRNAGMFHDIHAADVVTDTDGKKLFRHAISRTFAMKDFSEELKDEYRDFRTSGGRPRAGSMSPGRYAPWPVHLLLIGAALMAGAVVARVSTRWIRPLR